MGDPLDRSLERRLLGRMLATTQGSVDTVAADHAAGLLNDVERSLRLDLLRR